MTTADKIAALPEMPNPFVAPGDMTINEFRVDTIKSLRARLTLARELLEESACSCFLEHRESGEHNKNVCNRCAFLVKMDREL